MHEAYAAAQEDAHGDVAEELSFDGGLKEVSGVFSIACVLLSSDGDFFG